MTGAEALIIWQLWACLPDRGPAGCLLIANPMGETACLIDMADLAKQVPPGTRLACVSVKTLSK